MHISLLPTTAKDRLISTYWILAKFQFCVSLSCSVALVLCWFGQSVCQFISQFLVTAFKFWSRYLMFDFNFQIFRYKKFDPCLLLYLLYLVAQSFIMMGEPDSLDDAVLRIALLLYPVVVHCASVDFLCSYQYTIHNVSWVFILVLIVLFSPEQSGYLCPDSCLGQIWTVKFWDLKTLSLP